MLNLESSAVVNYNVKMALDTTKKKRNLLNIVDRLVEKTGAKSESNERKKQEVSSPSPRPPISIIKPYLLPPTPSSGPTSPSISDQESVSDMDEQASQKGADEESEEIKKSPGVPKQPMRCDVCGLRVHKSYRFVNRTSAPAHLKNFITPENDRIRVCKSCFSSRERCRKNLSLILLRSKTSQMTHLRTPLGVTHGRATKAMEYIARDLKKGFKRPYDDLLCDETMVDEDEMEVDNERFLLDGDTAKNLDAMPKLFAVEKENAKQASPTPVPVKNTGIITVVKGHSGKYNSTSNCFTIYKEIDNLKVNENVVTTKASEQNENNLQINVAENLKKLADQNSSLPSAVNITSNLEINTINNKLTFLDHAYALPPPKGKALSVLRAQAVTKVKAPTSKAVKETNASKQEPQTKTASTDGQISSERTCGIVCFMCDNLVTKSYSCYKKENAPEKIKHLFTPGVKVVKVCRRCMPYKKPKEDGGSAVTGKGKVKVVKGKLAKIKSAKLVKNAKSTGKANSGKMNEKKVFAVKSPSKDDKKQKDGIKEDKTKVSPIKKQYTIVVQTKKLPTSKVAVAKDGKLSSTKPIQVVMGKLIIPPKEEAKLEGGKSVNFQGANTSTKVLPTSPKSSGQKSEKGINAMEKLKDNSFDSEQSAANKPKSAKVDFGTQSMKSMIGINKVKTKSAECMSSNGTVTEDKPEITLNEKAGDKSMVGTLKQVNMMEQCTVASSDTSSMASNDVKTSSQTQKEDVEQELKRKSTNSATKEDNMEDYNKVKENKVLLLEQEKNTKSESKSMEETKTDVKLERVAPCKNIAEGVKVRETRSSSRSPVRTREMKPVEVSSPRRGRSSGTPDKKHEDYKQIVPTVMTRKRLASFSESEVDSAVGNKRRAVVALLEKMSRKSGETSQNVSATKVKEESSKEEVSDVKDNGHSMTRRNQIPIKCPGCNQKVVKSYRCFMRGSAPSHIKPLFTQQANPGEMLRICRKCLKGKGKS